MCRHTAKLIKLFSTDILLRMFRDQITDPATQPLKQSFSVGYEANGSGVLLQYKNQDKEQYPCLLKCDVPDEQRDHPDESSGGMGPEWLVSRVAPLPHRYLATCGPLQPHGEALGACLLKRSVCTRVFVGCASKQCGRPGPRFFFADGEDRTRGGWCCLQARFKTKYDGSCGHWCVRSWSDIPPPPLEPEEEDTYDAPMATQYTRDAWKVKQSTRLTAVAAPTVGISLRKKKPA